MHVFEAWLHLFHPRRSNNHRPHLLHAESLFGMMMMAIAFVAVLSITTQIWSGTTGRVLGFATTITADQVIAQTNVRRSALGLPPLTTSTVLAQAAQLKAQDMFANQYWAHTSPQGKEPWDFIRTSGYNYQAAGENLARDFMSTPDMINAWMNSPSHRANIVNPRYQEIGIAVVNGTLDGTETTLVVQMFGRPRDVTVAPAIAPAITTAVAASATPDLTQPEEVLAQSPQPELTPVPVAEPTILSAMSLITGNIRPWPVVSPLQLTKAFFLSIVVLLITTLAYDWALMQRSPQTRVVGHNLAHILFLTCIIFLLITFHSGAIR